MMQHSPAPEGPGPQLEANMHPKKDLSLEEERAHLLAIAMRRHAGKAGFRVVVCTMHGELPYQETMFPSVPP